MRASLASGALVLALALMSAVRGDRQSSNLTNSLEFPKPKSWYNECKLPVCYKAAEHLLATAKLDRDPCDDFYQYACGKMLANSQLKKQHNSTPLDKRYSFDEADKAVRLWLRQLLAHQSDHDDDPVLKQMLHVYSTCTNRTEMRNSGLKGLKWKLDQLGLPMLNDICTETPKPHDWSQLLTLFKEHGFPYMPIFKFEKKAYSWGPRLTTMELANLDSYIEELMLDKNKVAQLMELLKNINPRLEVHKAEAQLKLVFEFASRLKQLLLPPASGREVGLINLVELTKLAPHTKWLSLIQNMTSSLLWTPRSEILVQIDQKQLTKIDELLNQTSPETLANFLVLPVVNILEPIVDHSQEDTKRIDYCLDKLSDSGWYYALASFFVRHKFTSKHRLEAQNMIVYLKRAFEDRLIIKGSWLDLPTKLKVKEKLDEMKFIIGYPRELLDDQKLSELYAGLLPNQTYGSENKPAAAWLIDMIFRSNKLMNKSTEAEFEWLRLARVLNANAFYLPIWNTVMVNAATILGPFNDLDLPHNMRYGALAGVIAHEIWHGFDNEGRKYGPQGQRWDWSSFGNRQYERKAECFTKQYDAVLPPGVNGSYTLGENIADNGAILTDFTAYKLWNLENRKEYERLPGVNLNPKQLFWVSWAMLMCSNQPYSLDMHSPPNLRVNLPAMNSPEFSLAFKCAHYAPMNPLKKCSLW